MTDDVAAYWHLADKTTVLGDVCFRGQSGHCADLWECLLLTHSGHERLKIAAVQTDP